MSSEDPTQQLPDVQSFETRVLAALANITVRLERLEGRSYDTKPIWERALAEIVDVGKKLDEFRNESRRSFQILNNDLFSIRNEQQRTDERLERLEGPHS